MKKASLILSAVAMAAFVSQAAAQEKAPAPAPAPKGTVIVQPAPAHGYAAPNYHYQPDCCNHGNQGGWMAGAELLILKAHFDHGVDELNSDSEQDELPGFYDAEPKWDLGVRLWAGCVNCDGYGARVRFFWFDSEFDSVHTGEEEGFDPVLPRNRVEADLEVYALDLEGIATTTLGGIQVTLSAGARFAGVDSGRARFASDRDPFDTIHRSQSEFSGYGPTIAIEGRGTMGSCALFAGTRVALLFGETELSFSNVDPDEPGDLRTGVMTENDDMVYVLELQLGGEYNFCCGDADGFIRVALEAQLWGGAALDGFAGGPGLPDPRPQFNGLNERTTADSNLGLVGITIGAGLKY